MQICADTMIGNQLIRGISGGQKKRVTTGEIVLLQHTEPRRRNGQRSLALQHCAAGLIPCT